MKSKLYKIALAVFVIVIVMAYANTASAKPIEYPVSGYIVAALPQGVEAAGQIGTPAKNVYIVPLYNKGVNKELILELHMGGIESYDVAIDANSIVYVEVGEEKVTLTEVPTMEKTCMTRVNKD